MYARGILFGKMKYELGDHSYVRCPENNLVADLDFKTKGYFYGTYNAIGGTIRDESTGEIYYELSGQWNAEMYIKDVAVCLALPVQPDSGEILITITDRPEGALVRRKPCEAFTSVVKAYRATGRV